MRAELIYWGTQFPLERAKGDSAFKGSPMVEYLSERLPEALKRLVPELENRFQVKGSAGQGQWTLTPWLSILDPIVTTTVQDGFFIVYLLSVDGGSLFLSLNQGCTKLRGALGIARARTELHRRAEVMRSRIRPESNRFARVGIKLGANVWRANLYEAGEVLSVKYSVEDLPSNESLASDVRESINIYGQLRRAGGWEAEDEMIRDAELAGKGSSLAQAKQYRQHRSIERQSSHSKAVKKALGSRCMACNRELVETYGAVADGLIDAHHLTPLASLDEGEVVRFDPVKDFAVLCPNCHRVIHRMDDVSDIDGLRELISATYRDSINDSQ